MVAVLMSTYNGETYLQEQIDSVLSQTFSGFDLIIRDDGSTDGTREIVASFRDPRIRWIPGENLGPAKSFFALLEAAKDYDYLFFCDQDDVWFPSKMEEMLAVLREKDGGPAMVFSDFCAIDGAGNTTAPSYAEQASLRVREGRISVRDLLMHPYVFGCAACINRALADLIRRPPEGIEMHDCWISLTAASLGGLYYYPRQTIAHRFHASNATGRSGQNGFAARLKRITGGFRRQCENTALRLRQAQLLLDRFSEKMLPSERDILHAVTDAARKGKPATVKTLKRLGIGRQKKLNTTFLYLTVLNVKGDIL